MPWTENHYGETIEEHTHTYYCNDYLELATTHKIIPLLPDVPNNAPAAAGSNTSIIRSFANPIRNQCEELVVVVIIIAFVINKHEFKSKNPRVQSSERASSQRRGRGATLFSVRKDDDDDQIHCKKK
jgi:hypothetical protein